MGKRSRTKGAAFERTVAKMIDERGVAARRGLQSRGGGYEVPDVETTTDPERRQWGIEHDALAYHFEAKCGARPNVWAAWEQANADRHPSREPCVIMHRDQAKPGEGATELLVLDLQHGLDLLVEVQRLRDALDQIVCENLPEGTEFLTTRRRLPSHLVRSMGRGEE